MAYPTSDLYKVAIDSESRTTFIDGELRPVQGEVVKITNDLLDTGGLYITNQCVNSDAFEYGSVFTAELGITLKTEIDRYTLYDAEIELFYNILLGDKSYERIPLGIFYVNEPSRVGRNILIKAYDKMVSLDEEIFESLTGTPYELLAYISARCNVSLAQVKSDIEMFTNGKILLTVSPERVKTYRELLSYICQITCTFAVINRRGYLELCKYNVDTVSKKIDAKNRTASKFSDFETYFSGAKGEFIFNDTNKAYMQTDGGSGLIYDMGFVPIVQGIDATNHAVVANVSLETSYIKYVPCDISFKGDPSIDLGDMIINVDRNGNEITSIVTFYKWSYRGHHQLKSAGQNPKLSKVKGKASRELETLRNEVSTKDVSVYTFTNGSEVVFSGGEFDDVTTMNSLASVSFAVKKASTCMVMVTIPISMSDESIVEFHQLLDGLEILGGVVSQRCHKGMSTITFVNYFNTKSNSIHRYSIVGITKGIDGVDSGILTVSPYSLKVIVFGQGLESVVRWDGNIIVNDSIPKFEVTSGVSPINISDEVMIGDNPYNPHVVSDKIVGIAVNSNIDVVGLLEAITTGFDLNDL